MSRRKDSDPPKLQYSDVIKTHANDPIEGLMTLDTDDGVVSIAITEASARDLYHELATFLGYED